MSKNVNRFRLPHPGAQWMVRNKEGRYVKHDDYLSLWGELIQEKKAAFDVIKQNIETNKTIQELKEELKDKENEIRRLRGQSDGLVLAVNAITATRLKERS